MKCEHQPHPHSGGLVGVQTTSASGSCQTDQCTLWGNLSRGSDAPLLFLVNWYRVLGANQLVA